MTATDSLLVAALLRGLIAAAALAAVLLILRRGGPRLAGLVAAVPVTSAPALFWIGYDLGAASAAAAALAALYATGLTALLAVAYGQAARRFGAPLVCLAAALLAVAVLGLLTGSLSASVIGATAFAVLAIALALRWMPRPHGAASPRRAGRYDFAFTLAVSALATAAISALAPHLPAQWCGLIAAIPVIGITTTVLLHKRAEPAALGAFLRAYVSGNAAKAVFLLALTVTLVPLGLAGGWLAALAAAVGCIALAGWRRRPAATPVGAREPTLAALPR
ncbi:MAG: hypothetical protein ACK5TK_09625 [Betaproteobacteria bacterium]